MVRVRTDSPAALTRRGDRYAALLKAELAYVADEVAANLTEPVTLDDLSPVTDLWNERVRATLLPSLGLIWREAADDVADQVQRAANDRAKRLRAAALPDPGAFVVPQVPNDRAEDYLASRQNFVTNLGADLWEEMRDQLLEGFEAGESIGDLSERVIAAAGLTEGRAERVARTEVVGASNAGSMSQMQETGLPMTKTWLATTDARTRDSHVAADGQTVALDEPFDVGGELMERPHDEGASAAEVVNCRCTVTFEVAEDMLSVAPADEVLPEPDEAATPASEQLSGREFDSLAAGKSFITDHFGAWEKALTNPEYSGRSFYQSPGFALMNGLLRGLKKGEIKSDVSFTDADLARARKSSTNLKKAIAKAPPLNEPLIVHRGFSADQFGELVKGMIIKDKGFTSTSLTDDVEAVGKATSPAVARILLPAGTRAGAGTSRELILNAGSEFEVISVSKKAGVTHVELRLVVK